MRPIARACIKPTNNKKNIINQICTINASPIAWSNFVIKSINLHVNFCGVL